MLGRLILHGSIAGTVLAVLPPPALGQRLDRTYTFRIPAGSLDSALHSYAKITGRQVLYRVEIVRGLRSTGVSGTFSADAALARVLAGTSLTSTKPATNVVVIQAASTTIDAAAVQDPAEQPGSTADQDIVVTGTNIRGASSTSPVTRITRRDIDRSGESTVAEVITSQPANYGGTGSPVASLAGTDRTGLNSSLATAVNLRGLGSEATLTIINGRRVAGAGGRGDFTDLSAIPSLGVERVEILTDGASAIYGSDAVAGVVNIMMRDDLTGLEARVRGLTSTRTGEKKYLATAALGTVWDRGSAGVVYEYGHDDNLNLSDRPYTATGDLRPFGGSDQRNYLSAPATILAFNAAAGGYVPSFAVPSTGASSFAQLRPGSNLTYSLVGSDLSPRTDRHIGYGYLNQQLGDVELHFDVRLSSRRYRVKEPPQATIFSITPANPNFISVDGAPFSIIGYSFAGEVPNSVERGSVQDVSATGALGWRPGLWSIDGYVTYARERSRNRSNGLLNNTLLDEALGNSPDDPATAYSTARDGFFNPYGAGKANSATILNFVDSGYTSSLRTTNLVEGSLKGDGPIVSIFGSELRGAIGGAVRHEQLRKAGENFYSGTGPSPAPVSSGDRTIEVAFGELNLPVVGGPHGGTTDVGLDLSVAGRYEHYPDFGSTFNPKVGVGWRPAPDIQLHASWGTSFRAPALTDLKDPFRVAVTQLPLASGAYTPVIILLGGNPDLKPEKARTWNVGVVLTPPAIPTFRFETNVFRTKFSQRIGQPVLQNIISALSDADVANFVQSISPATSSADLARIKALLATPGATGLGIFPDTAYTAIIEARNVNTTTLTVSGLDASARVAPQLWGGELEAGVAATWLFSYKQQLTPISTPLERIDRLAFPASLRANFTLGYARGIFAGTLIGRYVGGYTDNLSAPSRSIGSWFETDATFSISPNAGVLKGWGLSLVAENLFDRDPPFVDRAIGIGFDAANANPFGRTVAVQLSMTF